MYLNCILSKAKPKDVLGLLAEMREKGENSVEIDKSTQRKQTRLAKKKIY